MCKLYCFDDWKVAPLRVCVEATLSLIKSVEGQKKIIKSSELHSKPEELYDTAAILDLTRQASFQIQNGSCMIKVYEKKLLYDPYGPARAFNAKVLRKSPYEGHM